MNGHAPSAAEAESLTLDQIFARSARRFASRIAVQEGRHRLTYAQAERHATQLASALVRGGAQLGDALIVHCESHRQALVAQLAVLKAGGVCVPVSRSPGGPEVLRLAEWSGARAILCSRSTYVHGGGPGTRVASLVLDDPATWRKIAGVAAEPALPRSGPEEAAHLVFHRASGRLVDHRTWGSSLAARVRRVGRAARTVIIDEPPMAPLALAAMWWAFAGGGTLRTRSPAVDLSWPVVGGVSDAVVLSPERYARTLAAAGGGRTPGPGREPGTIVLFGGGPCASGLVARHFAVRPGTALWAEFAPRGGPVPWTAQRLLPRDPARAGHQEVGRPVSPVRVRVIGLDGQALPPGRIGEVVAAGPAWPFEDSWRTGRSARAVPGPEGASLLSSGWYGRWSSDQTLEVVGRRLPESGPTNRLRPPTPSTAPERNRHGSEDLRATSRG
ncbi:AMP-binding protein [Streptomyces sp. NBC_01803]|uniref:AMP-binding protein n=1 Tax=Streptomyces sp. NBC_01803 TaxID=2975946 RepID=UPI002DDB9003|nr:AMP-binding protein [Streptomyces sp. NBC_01803]WSA43158.1 acyl--CoA ligase [Streptomyces sp. NBC_01803]